MPPANGRAHTALPPRVTLPAPPQLFKPGLGHDGGFIRVSMSYLLPDQVRSGNGQLLGEEEEVEKKRRG